MPVFLSALAIALTSATSISSVTNTVAVNKKIINGPLKSSNQISILEDKSQEILLSKNLSTAIEKLKNNSALSDEQIKAMIENSIIYNESGELEFSLTQLKRVEKTEFFQLISSNYASSKEMLSQLLEGNLLQYSNETKSFHFKDFEQATNLTSRIWVVHQWSWFAYWELHFDHAISKLLYEVGEIGGNIVDIINALEDISGLWGVGVNIIGKACKSMAYYFGEFDKGNGVCMRWDAVIPRDVVSR